ncbi:MAG: UbiA prenyltransferase family protein [Muribaculaceae bacterium]|nr:UbiA prenyltransferase family protein [Muribaculaceae bacterium]
MKKLKDYISLLRVPQWVKNAFVALPLFFDGSMTDTHRLWLMLLAVLSFSLAASAVYCLNDVMDVKADRLHPVKCLRPLASGRVSRGEGLGLMLLCLAASVALCVWLLPTSAFYVLAVYVVLNVAYSLLLKHIGILDMLIVAGFYVLRILFGGAAVSIRPTSWLLLMAFLLALFLVIAKRRDDVLMMQDGTTTVRKSAQSYNLEFINLSLTLVATITIVCYIMYTMSPETIGHFHSDYVYATSVFVIAGILRYMQVTIVAGKSGSPTKLLFKDHFVQLCLIGWVLAFVLIIYVL